MSFVVSSRSDNASMTFSARTTFARSDPTPPISDNVCLSDSVELASLDKSGFSLEFAGKAVKPQLVGLVPLAVGSDIRERRENISGRRFLAPGKTSLFGQSIFPIEFDRVGGSLMNQSFPRFSADVRRRTFLQYDRTIPPDQLHASRLERTVRRHTPQPPGTNGCSRERQ